MRTLALELSPDDPTLSHQQVTGLNAPSSQIHIPEPSGMFAQSSTDIERSTHFLKKRLDLADRRAHRTQMSTTKHLHVLHP
jgi:hypothetical protein